MEAGKPVSEAAVVQCTRRAQTKHTEGTLMSHVTVIALTTSDLTHVGPNTPRTRQDWNQIAHITAQAASAGVQTICVVCPDTDLSQAELPSACHILNSPKTPSWIERGIARAVEVTPQSSGWLILAAQAPSPPDNIWQMMISAIGAGQPTAVPSKDSRETAIGLSSEFYSELIKLYRAGDLKRLICRYPVHIVCSEAPGPLGARQLQ